MWRHYARDSLQLCWIFEDYCARLPLSRFKCEEFPQEALLNLVKVEDLPQGIRYQLEKDVWRFITRRLLVSHALIIWICTSEAPFDLVNIWRLSRENPFKSVSIWRLTWEAPFKLVNIWGLSSGACGRGADKPASFPTLTIPSWLNEENRIYLTNRIQEFYTASSLLQSSILMHVLHVCTSTYIMYTLWA